MFHQLIMRYLDSLNNIFGLIENPIVNTLVYLLLTLIASYITYNILEIPFNKKIKNKILKKSYF